MLALHVANRRCPPILTSPMKYWSNVVLELEFSKSITWSFGGAWWGWRQRNEAFKSEASVYFGATNYPRRRTTTPSFWMFLLFNTSHLLQLDNIVCRFLCIIQDCLNSINLYTLRVKSTQIRDISILNEVVHTTGGDF